MSEHRLIYADELLEVFEQYLDEMQYVEESISKSARLSLIKWVIDKTNEQPTAYDTDRVIEQLEELEKEVIYHGCEVDRIADVVQDAIEIVKKGGKL